MQFADQTYQVQDASRKELNCIGEMFNESSGSLTRTNCGNCRSPMMPSCSGKEDSVAPDQHEMTDEGRILIQSSLFSDYRLYGDSPIPNTQDAVPNLVSSAPPANTVRSNFQQGWGTIVILYDLTQLIIESPSPILSGNSGTQFNEENSDCCSQDSLELTRKRMKRRNRVRRSNRTRTMKPESE
jgi:hypothetical protein